MSAGREEYLSLVAFMERAQSAHMITCDAATGRPLFAHWIKPSRWKHQADTVLIAWCGEPTPEVRLKAERVTARMLFDGIKENIQHDRLHAPELGIRWWEGDQP